MGCLVSWLGGVRSDQRANTQEGMATHRRSAVTQREANRLACQITAGFISNFGDSYSLAEYTLTEADLDKLVCAMGRLQDNLRRRARIVSQRASTKGGMG